LIESVDAVSVVFKEESSDVDEVHEVAFGEGEGLAGEPADALAQREVESLDMICFSVLLGTRAVLLARHHVLVGAPEVGEDETRFVSGRNLVPQRPTAEH